MLTTDSSCHQKARLRLRTRLADCDLRGGTGLCSRYHDLEAVLGLPRHHRWQANRNHQLQDLDLDSSDNYAEHILLVRRAMHCLFDFHQAVQDFFQLDLFPADGHPLHYSVEGYPQCLHQEQVVFRVGQHPMHQDQDFVQAHQREHYLDLWSTCQRDFFLPRLVLPKLEVDFGHLDRDH